MAALAFLAGILLVQKLPTIMSLWTVLWLLPTLLLSWRRPQLFFLPVFVAGLVYATAYAGYILEQQVPDALQGKDIQVQGKIIDIPKRSNKSTRFLFEVDNATYQQQKVTIPSRIMLRFYYNKRRQNRSFQAGQHWQFTVRLKRPHGFQNPGGFDYEAYLFRNAIRATGYVRPQPVPRYLDAETSDWSLARFRQQLGNQIWQQTKNKSLAGMMIALANGNRDRLTDEQWTRMRQTGTSHLVAISGLHVGLVAGFVFLLIRRLWCYSSVLTDLWPAQKAAALFAIAVAAVYAAMAGFSVPTQRALIMLTVVMGAIIIQQRMLFSKLLAMALVLVLLRDPMASIDIGFWLSFSAVTFIAYAAQQSRVRDGRVFGLLRIQWAIFVGLLPLMLLFFQSASVISPVANLIAVPVFGFVVVPLVLTGCVALFIFPHWQQNIFFDWAAGSIELIWELLDKMITYGPKTLYLPEPLGWMIVCAFVGALMLLAPGGWPGRWLGVIWIAPLFVIKPMAPKPAEVWLTLLDVGQGLAVVVRTHKHTLVFDTGPRFNQQFDTGKAVVLPYLYSQGIGHINRLVISHGDNDHIGGARSILSEIPADDIITSVKDRIPGSFLCQAGQHWQWDLVNFQVIHPDFDPPESDNNSSCVLRISSVYGSILLPGDIEAQAEQRLLESSTIVLESDVMVAPHHGSKTSSTDAFLDAVNPDVVLIPAGYRNRYRHPHVSITQRYRRHGIRTYGSAESGAVTVRLSAQGMAISEFRKQNRRYWFNF